MLSLPSRNRITRIVLLTIFLGSSLSHVTWGQDSGAELPDLMGDNFDGGGLSVTFDAPVLVNFQASGVLLPGTDTVALERDMMGFPDDIFANQAFDSAGNPIPNLFLIDSEPIPPSEIPTSPGDDFEFEGGTAVYEGADPLVPGEIRSPFDVTYAFSQTQQFFIPAGGGGVAVRRLKLSENNNPIPQTRVFFNFNFFNDVPLGLGDISRYTLGFERAFDNTYSWEFRVPFAATLDAVQNTESIGARNFEFGNAVVIFKRLLRRTRHWAFTAGTGVSIPTASSTVVNLGDTTVLKIQNDSSHWLPFAAIGWTPDSPWFGQAFVQFDVDSTGNPVLADVPTLGNVPTSRSLPQIGVFNDASILFVDMALGRWLVRNQRGNRTTGFALMGELHYLSTLNDTDSVSGNGLTVGDISPRIDQLNLTLGTHAKFASGFEFAVGGVIPIRRGSEQPFDYEITVQTEYQF